MPKPLKFHEVLGPHPKGPNVFGTQFSHTDSYSSRDVPTRALSDQGPDLKAFVLAMRAWIKSHHASPEALIRDAERKGALKRQGFAPQTKRFPTADLTQKGNWCEILLAEYISASSGAQLPVYRLRYNPNVQQSMKGDDVLAFDLQADPIRIIVGEAKFRSTAAKPAVVEMVTALEKSQLAGLPTSLTFVVDRLFETGNDALAKRIDECGQLFVQGKLQLDYVGLLVSDAKGHERVKTHASSSFRRLAVLSLALDNPGDMVKDCFAKIEEP